eukprot:TRINITY_DN9617_c0_g1_i2.p2 TRINITY_DN9617_c0_g1~~TRINITY_DN9617_c0_g1_i2.p2  ORF type:complete len:128 (+),score=29.07 TRINITY_DN9617_c0_g1_i2:919-1302(+)
MTHRMLKKKVEKAINLTKGRAMNLERTIWDLNRKWREPTYKNMKDKFKSGGKYSPGWEQIKKGLKTREKIELDNIGTEKLTRWIKKMKELRNQTKNIYRRMSNKIQREIKRHNDQIMMEIGMETFKK